MPLRAAAQAGGCRLAANLGPTGQSRRTTTSARCSNSDGGSAPVLSRREVAVRAVVVLAAAAANARALLEPCPASAVDQLVGEQAVVDIFDRSVSSVAVIYDVKTPVGGPPTVGQAEGNGSGFVWDSDGHVVTCYHVLSSSLDGSGVAPGARVAKVLFQAADGSGKLVLDGTLVGADKGRDLAVLKVDAPRPLAPLPLGRSDGLRPGQFVLAIGSPFGFTNSLTGGLISAVGRGFQAQTGSIIAGGIQHDADVNLGSSGGPLLDSAGRVIGINTALFRPGAATGSVGVSFALPINTARRVVGDLVAKGRVQRASLGVQPATEVVARAFNITSGGVLVQAVDPGSPADTAGLLGNRRGLRGVLVGDVIVAVDGRKIATLFDLSSLLDSCAPGQSVEVTAVRNIGSTEEERVTVTAVLEAEK